MNAALRGKNIGHAFTDEEVSREYTDEALLIVVSALGNDPLIAVQSYTTAKETWGKVQERYVGKTFMCKLCVLSSLLNVLFDVDEDMCAHIDKT